MKPIFHDPHETKIIESAHSFTAYLKFGKGQPKRIIKPSFAEAQAAAEELLAEFNTNAQPMIYANGKGEFGLDSNAVCAYRQSSGEWNISQLIAGA